MAVTTVQFGEFIQKQIVIFMSYTANKRMPRCIVCGSTKKSES